MRDTETLVDDGGEQKVGALRVVVGPDAGRELVLEGERATIGKSEAADFELTDPSVSRLHAELVRSSEGVHVRDLGSKNGLWLAGCRVGEAWLAPGARIQLGATVVEAIVARRPRAARSVAGGDRLGALLGRSSAMHALFDAITRVAPTSARVLVRGESGTGKELVAREIHRASERSGGPFVVVDGAAISSTLADDELFGHVRGAFTSAHDDRPGAFERAHGGTLFLDEVGDLPLDVQAKLLRAVETSSVQRIGASARTEASVRIVAATHRPLERMVNEGSFREDLLHRLVVATLYVPPLRDRHGDVPHLAESFLSEIAPDTEAGRSVLDEALAEREGYLWPGNVRELRSFVHRVTVLGGLGTEPPPPSDLPRVVIELPYREAKTSFTEFFERKYVRRLLEETGGNISEAARRAGLSRVHMSKLARKHRR